MCELISFQGLYAPDEHVFHRGLEFQLYVVYIAGITACIRVKLYIPYPAFSSSPQFALPLILNPKSFPLPQYSPPPHELDPPLSACAPTTPDIHPPS